MGKRASVTADLDPPGPYPLADMDLLGGGSKSASGYVSGGPYPLADLDRGIQF